LLLNLGLTQYGAFGKGTLSRGRPDYAERGAGVGRTEAKKFHRKREYKSDEHSTATTEAAAPEEIKEATKKREREETPADAVTPVADARAILSQLPEPLQYDPLRNEPLQLCLEEAFFLSYALECLTVKNSEGVRYYRENGQRLAFGGLMVYLGGYVSFRYVDLIYLDQSSFRTKLHGIPSLQSAGMGSSSGH
jgi:hypothetical protein